MKIERDRAIEAATAAMHLPVINRIDVSDEDLEAMKAAFRKRFDEDLPRTETLMAVAAIGYRMAHRDLRKST